MEKLNAGALRPSDSGGGGKTKSALAGLAEIFGKRFSNRIEQHPE